MTHPNENPSMNIAPMREGVPETTPYTRSPEEMRALLDQAVGDKKYRYLDSTTNPDMGPLIVCAVPGTDAVADLGRTLEAELFHKAYGYTKEFLEEDFSEFDENSEILLLVNLENDEKPELMGMLRIADASKGPSEAVEFFKEVFEDRPIPPELTLQSEKEGMWDIITVGLMPEYRDGLQSAWLYHGLYKRSLEAGVNKWVASMVPNEARNIREYIGAPFDPIPGIPEVEEPLPLDADQKITYGFYSMILSELEPAVREHLIKLDAETDPEMIEISALVAQAARIAVYGDPNFPTPTSV